MRVRTQHGWCGTQLEPSLLAHLAGDCVRQGFTVEHSTRRNLRSSFGVIAMVEDEKLAVPFDVHNDTPPELHRQIVGGRAFRTGGPRQCPAIEISQSTAAAISIRSPAPPLHVPASIASRRWLATSSAASASGSDGDTRISPPHG